MPLFEVASGGLNQLQPVFAGPDLYEKEIEGLLWDNLEDFLGEPLFALARQPKIEGGGIPDVVALDDSGRVVVMEVKRDVDRSQLAQCLEYAGWARSTNLDELAGLYTDGAARFFEDWQDFTESTTPVVVNPTARLVLIAGEIHGRTRSAVDFLVENGLPIQLIVVSIYSDGFNHKFVDVRLERPSNAIRTPISGDSQMSGVGQLYYQFWARYLERLHAEHPDWSERKAPLTQNWMNQPSPIKGTTIVPSFAAGGRLRHELYIDTGDEEANLKILKHLQDQEDLFVATYGRSVSFEGLPGKRACKIAEYRESSNVSDSDRYDEFIDWFFDAGPRLRTALQAVALP